MKKIAAVMREFQSFDSTLFRNSLAYSFLIALFPTLIAVVILFQYSILDINVVLDFLYRYLPESFIAPFISYIMRKTYQGIVAVVIALVAAFFLASKSMYSFMMISAKNESFNIPKILIRIKSYFLFVFLILGILVVATLLSLWTHTYKFTLPFGLLIILYIFYRALSFEKRPLSYGIVGAVVASVILILLGNVFFKIVAMFFSYDSLYGPMASLLVVLLSVHTISSVIYFGYCLNLIYGKAKDTASYKHERAYAIGENIINTIKKFIKRLIFR